jgi:ATP-dependent DNA helicase RecG
MKDVYEVLFSDGTTTKCGLEHLWKIKSRFRKEWEIKDIEYLLTQKLFEGDGRPRFAIELTQPVIFNEQNVKIDPYVMGVLLGDGSFRNILSITSADDEIINSVRTSLDNGYFLKYNGKYGYTISHGKRGCPVKNKYREIIRTYGLWMKGSHDKFIPKV